MFDKYKKFILWGAGLIASFLLLLYLASTIDRLFMPVVTLTAPRSGTLSYGFTTEVQVPIPEIETDETVETGDETTEIPAEPLPLTVTVSRETGAWLAVGDPVNAERAAGSRVERHVAAVTAIRVSPDLRTLSVDVTLPDTVETIPGELWQLSFGKTSEAYDTLVPLSALRGTGEDGVYDLFLAVPADKANTYTVTRVSVSTIYEQNDTFAAVKWHIPEGTRIITTTDRALIDGATVRTE